eukprot:1140771-Pelagomonas_calceolata.AAC.16
MEQLLPACREDVTDSSGTRHFRYILAIANQITNNQLTKLRLGLRSGWARCKEGSFLPVFGHLPYTGAMMAGILVFLVSS